MGVKKAVTLRHAVCSERYSSRPIVAGGKWTSGQRYQTEQ